MNMTAETSTYTYEGGTTETVSLTRGPLTPTGHALLKIASSDGRKFDCYVDLAWLRDRADQLADTPRPLTPDAIEVALRDCMPGVALDRLSGTRVMRLAEDMHAALTEPPARPEWDALHDVLSRTHRPPTTDELTDVLYAEGVRVMEGN